MDHERGEPYILGFVSDLIFQVKIEDAAYQLGYQVSWIERASQLAPVETAAAERSLGEPLVGASGALIDLMTRMHPALVIFDLGNAAIPWREWIAMIKSVPATRRLPLICFGPHVNVEALETARGLGADAVLARSRFASALSQIIEKWAKRIDEQAIASACEAPLSISALKGLALFNQGEFFEAHELLEAAWNEDATPGRELYRAILQVAVAYLQIERRNYKGAAKMFLRMRQWIDPLPGICRGVDVGRLRQEARQVHETLIALGPDRIHEFDHKLFRPVHYGEKK